MDEVDENRAEKREKKVKFERREAIFAVWKCDL